MLQPLDVEHCLASLSRSIPTLQWWRFKLSKPDNRKHVWISLPADVEVVCGKTSLLPKNSRLLGRLHVLHWGADCLVQGIHITPSEKDQVICIETRASDRDPRIFWIDVNQLAVTVSANGIQEIVDTSRPTQPLLGSHIWGWLSGLQIFCSQPQSITERCFLIPVDFSSRDDIAVLLSHNTKSDRVAVCKPASPSQKLIVVNPRTNELYSCHLDSTSSPFENAGMKVKKKEEVAEDEEENEELAFPASMMDEEATKRDTKLSETLVEIEDFLCRVIWTIQHPSDGCVGRDTNVEAQRCRIAMQLDEMQSCEEEDLKIHESNASLSLLEKLLGILTSLLEIGEMVNMHRRRDESCVLRLVDQKLPELTSWVDKSQLEESNVPLPQARQTLNQLACIQSAMQIFVGKAKPTTNLEAMIAKVKFCVGESLKNEIQEKLEEDAPSHEVSLKAGDIMTAFADSMRKYLSFLPTSVVWQLEKPSNPIQTLQHIKSSLVKNMAILKECCGWIPCILSEGIQQSLSIPQELLTDLKTIHDHAFTVYKQLEMYISLVCEHSGLYTLAVRLTNILERSTDEKLSQWQLSQMEQELDRCEAECAVEILSSGKENHAFVKMVARSLLEHTSVARNVTDDVPTIQEPRLSELLERLKSLTSTSNLSSPSAFFEALLIGWYLQSRSTIDSQVDELVCRLEQEVSVTLQDTLLLHLRISEMEEFLSQMSPIFTPYDAEASSLRDALLILSDVILRLNSAVQLLERMAFLTNLHLSQRLETLRFAYPGVLEGLTRCFRALKALLRELSEWRKCIVLVDDSDQYDTATQAVIEVVNFAINTITQDLQNVTGIKFFNVPDFLSEILEWLISFRSSLLGFRKMSCQYRLEKSVNYSHSSALLHDLLNLEWLLAESRLQSQRDLAHEIGGTAAGDLKTSWMASIQKILEDIEPTKRRRSLNLLEGMERSSREQRQSLLKLLMGSWETVESFEGVTLLNYIVARTEGFADLKVQLLEEKYSKTDDQSNVCEKPNSDVCKETFCTLMKNLSEEFRQLHDKQNGICDDLKIAECLRNSEILVKIGSQYVATSKCSLHLIDRVLFSYWPEALLKLIATDQSRGNKKSPADWRICALDFRNTVARRLAKGSFNIAGEGLSQVETKDVDGSLANLRMAIEEADRILHGIQDDFGMDTKDVWQACLRLHDLFQSYTSQLGRQINDLTLPSLRAVKKDLQSLDSRIKELAHGGSSPGVLEDCSQSVAHLEESLQALRQTARILFTCLATDSKLSPQVTPSKHLDVNELYKRAVKLVNDYEASEIGCQILEAWQRLQSIADKLGRLQAGLPLTESFSNYEALTAHSPIASTSDIHLDGFSSASMARKRSWSLLEILGSHECLYPGCRGKKRDKHESHIADDGLLHDLHGFYSLLCSEFHDRAMRIPVEVLTSNTQKAASSEVALMNLRQEWHRDMGLVNQFNNLQRRAKMDDSRRSEIKTSLCLIETIWGETTPPNVFFEATERLATVSSWLCEVERHLDLDVLPRLQTAWKNSTGTDTLSVVEECVYKMNEIAEDLEGLEKNGILAERHLKNVKHSLQTGWFNVREFLLNRCVGPAFHEDSTSARYFPLVDDFLRHSAELGFQDCGLKATHTRLCNQYLLHGLTQRAHHPVEGGRKFCSTNRSLRLLFLPPWLTERCRIVQHRPPIALAIHSIPDISTEIYPPLSNATELAFHSPKCAALQSRRWFSLPDIRSQSPIHQDYEVNSNFIASKDEAEVNSPEETPNEVVMKTSQLSFSALPSEDEKTEAEEEEPTISEEPRDLALMRDVQLLLAQLKSQHLPLTNDMDVNANKKNSEPNECQETEERERSTTLTPPECQVSRKLRDKSPITWCTVYLPNDEETVPSTHPETLTERGVVQIASDPLMPKCEPYTPMVFSAPHEVSDQQGGQIAEPEEALEDVEGMRECNPSITDDSGVCDWLRSQQAENIERLMKECEADDDKEDMSLTGMDDPSGASVLLEMPFPRTKNSVSNSFEESGFGDEEWSRRSHELPTHQTSDSLFTCGVENCPVNEAKGGRVDWGPCVERLESPHLSVITEDSTNNSTLERHQYIDDNVLKSSQEISEAEGLDNSSGFITVAPKKTRSRKNRDVKKKCEEVEEEEGTRKFPFSPPEIATFWNGGNKHDALTPTPTGLVVKDESQRTKLQEGDLEEENGKTISEVESFEVRTKEDESAEPLRITMKSSTDSVDGTDAEEEQFQGEIREHRRELTEDNDMEGLGAEISAVEKRSSQTIEDARNASEVESQVPGGDGILETTALLEAENDNFLEPRCEPRIALVQRDTERVHKQVDRKVKIKGAELLPRENIATREARKQASGEDLDRQSGKVSAMEKIDKSIARNSAKIKKKMKNSQQKKWSKDQLARAASASDGKTDSRSTVDQEFQVLDNHGKDENLLNRFQSAAKFERGGSTKPNGKNKKYQALKNGRGVNEFDDLSNVKGHGNNSSGAYVKCTREAHKKVKKEPTSNYLQDNLFHSIFAGVVEDGFNSEFIYNGLSEYVPRSDDEAKQETEGVKIAKVMKDTKGTGSCLQKKGEDGKTSGSLFEGAYPVYVNEPFAVWNGNQWNPAVPNSEFDHCEMDQQNASEDLELNNKEVLLTSLHLDGLWEAEAKQAILNEANSTKGSGKEEAVWDQVVESTVAIQSSNDFSSTLKEYTCQDPGQSVCVTSNVDENGSQPEDMSSIKKNERKNKRCRSKRDFGREAGNKEVAPSAHREINEKAQFGNEAVSIATEFRPRVGEGGLDKKSNNQLDLPDLDEGSPSNPKENSNSAVRKSGTEGDEEEKNGKEKVDLDEPRKPNELEETDATEGFLPSEEFETYAGEDGKEGVSHELHPQRGRGTLKEYLKEGEESRKHAAEGCDTSDEIDQSSPKASEPRFMKSGKRKHRNRRHLMCEGEVEERNSCVVSDSQEVSSIEATVNLKTSKEIADVGYPLQSEESKGELGFVRDGQEPEVEKQTSNELKEVTQPVECDILINGLTTQPQDEPQINERESEDVGGTLHEVVEFGEANAAEHLHETISWSSEQEEEEEEVEERLQNGSDVEGVGAELSPLTNDDVLRGGTKGDAEHHERPAEGRITLDEIDQFKSLQEVADLSCAGELGQPSMKDGKRKRHRKGRNLTSEVKVGGRPGSTVFASQKAATTEAEVEVKASVVTADVRYPMQSEKVEDTLEIVDSDQELVSELEKQSTIVLDKVSQSAEHEVVVNESAGETEDEPQINECELKVQGDSVIALRTSGKVSDVEHLHELKVHSLKHEDRGEEVGRLQNEGYAEGADGDLQPQINKDFLREYTREDTVSQEDPAEFDQSEATPRVVALPSLKVPEAPSAKGGKRNKKHRKARHLPVEAKTQGLDSSAPLPEKVMTGISDEAEFHPSKTVVDEQETALDLLKETSQPLQHENLLNDSSEHLKDWPRISNHKLEVRDVEAIGDELQPQTNEETLKNSTVEIVESEGSQIFSVLSESEGVPVRSESKKRHRKGKHTRGEGEIKTPKTNADTGYSIESKEGAKAKDTATGDVALVSDALGEISLPNEEELMEEEMTGHLQCETQSSNCKLEGQAMIVDDSKPHSAEEDTKKWDHEESEDESKPQKTGDISRECTDEGDAESYKHSTEGGCNVNEVVESEANQDVDVSSSSHEPEAPLVKRMKKKKHRKRKQLLHEALVVLGVELPLQPGKDGTALDVATDDQKTVPGIDKHSTVALEEVAVKGSFSYLKGEPQINECELEVHGDLVHEFKGTGDANRTVHLNESKLHPLEHAKNQMHREEEECGHRSDGSEFEGAGDNLQVQTSNEVLKEIAGEREESYEYPTEVEDNGDEVVGAEARQTTDALSTLQEPEGISIKTEERNQHREDGCLHDEADAQNLKVPTAPLSKEVLSMNNEDEVKPAKTSDDEHECVFGPMKEIFRSKEHEAVVNESFGPVNSELQTSECTMGVQGESVPESRSPVKAGGPKPQTMKQREEEQLQEESDIEGVRDEPQFQKSNDVVSADVKEASEHQVCSAEGRDTLNELDQSEAVRRAVDLPSVEGFEALSTKGRKKKKQKKRRHIMDEIEVDDIPASTVLASSKISSMEADADLKTSEIPTDMGCPMQPEEAEGILDIAGDDNESVPEIGKQFTVILDEVPQPVEHEFVVNELTDQPEDESQTNECESEVVGETRNEYMGFGKINVVEQLHEIRARSSEQDEGVEEHLQDESDVEGGDVELGPAASNDVIEGGTEGDAEPQEHPAESSITLAEIGRSETPQKVVDSLSAEEPEAPFIKGGKRKKHRKGRHLTGEAMVEDRLASTVPDSQGSCSMEAEVVLRSPEVTADVGLPMQPEEVKDTLDIVDDEQELVPEFEKQPTIVFDEVSQSVQHEFLFNESSDQPEDELQINECESEVADEALNERTGLGKGNVGEQLHATRAQSSEREEGVEEHLQDVSGAEGVGIDLPPQTTENGFREGKKEQAQPEAIPAKGNDILDKIDQSETAHGSVGLPSLEIPEVPPIKDGKKKKQRKRRHIMGEAEFGGRPTSAVLAVDDQESVSEIEKQANNAIEEAPQPTPHDFVVNDLTDHLDDWFTTKECDTEVQEASADEFGTICKANAVICSYETEARSSEYENTGIEEHMQDEVDVEGVSKESQHHTGKDSLEEYTKADSESQENTAEGRVIPDEIDQSEALQKIVDTSSAEEVEAPSMKGRKKKHRKGRNLRGEAEVEYRPASQETFSMDDAANFKTSEKAADVRCPMQPEEDKSPPNVAVGDEKSASSTLEEISQSNKQELMEKELPSHLEGGTQPVPFELEIPGSTGDESRTIFQFNDLVPFRETDKQFDKRNKKPSHCGAEGKFWHDGLCLEGVVNATQPHTDDEDLDGSLDETAGSQEHSKEGENTVGETVECEAILSDGSSPSLRKLESPSTNRVKATEIEKEQYQKGNSASLLEEQLLQSSFDGVNTFRDVMPQGEPSPELSEIGEIWVTKEVDSTFKNRPTSDESFSSYPKYKDSLELEDTESLRNPALECDGHLSIPQIRLDIQEEFDLTESVESRGSSKEHVESGAGASQAKLVVEEVPSNQEKEKPGRMESTNDYSGDEKLPNLWVPILLPLSKARETVEGKEPELSRSSNDRFTLHAPDLEKLAGERSQISDFATSDDLAVTLESTHSPDASSSPKIDDSLPLSRDSSPNSDEDLFQADSAMEIGEGIADTESKSTQEQVSLSPDISKPPSQKSKENSKKQGKKKKQQKEKTLECRRPIQVVDAGMDERRSPEQLNETMPSPSPEESDAGSTKLENKKKKQQKRKCAKNAHRTEENSKFLPFVVETEKYPIDKAVREAECVQITSTSPTSKEASESSSEQVYESNVQGISSDFEGRSPVIVVKMEFQKESIPGSDVERTTGDEKESGQEGDNLECNSEQIESWKEAERLKYPAATTQETVDPNRTVNVQIHGNMKESMHRAKELDENAEAQRKDEEEPGVNEFPEFVCQEYIDVDGDKGEYDQLSKEADTLVGNMEGKDGSNLEESHGIEEMGPCQILREFGRIPTGMDSKGLADEHFRSDEKEVMNRVKGISDKDMKSTSQPSKGADGSEASLDHFVLPKPPGSEVQRNESHQGTWYTILDDPIPAPVGLENENLQKTESFKVGRKDGAEKESSESAPPHLNKATRDGNSVVVAEEEGTTGEESPPHDEHLGQTGSVHETESDMIGTDLPFSQESDNEVAELERSKKKHWKKGSTMNETVECLTPALEVDKPHESVGPVDETNIPTDAIESKVVDMDDDLLKKDMPQQEVEKPKNVECSQRVDIQDVGATSREPDSVGKVQGAITDVKIEEAFSSKSGKKRRKKEKTEKADYPSATSPPEMSYPSKSRQRWPINLQEVEKGDRDVATDSQQSLSVEAPVEDVQPDITSTPREGDILSSGSLTETTQPSDVATSLHPPSPLKADVEKEPCIVADVEIGRQIEIENVEVDEEEADEGAVTSTDHSFAFLEQSPSDTDEVDDFTVVVKAPPPRTIIEAEAPAEPVIIKPSKLQIRVKPRRWPWPGSFLILLLFLLFFLIPIIILFCIAAPDFCFLPGACPGLTLRQRINAYINDYHRQRMSPFPT